MLLSVLMLGIVSAMLLHHVRRHSKAETRVHLETFDDAVYLDQAHGEYVKCCPAPTSGALPFVSLHPRKD
jgi:hypothetical protein